MLKDQWLSLIFSILNFHIIWLVVINEVLYFRCISTVSTIETHLFVKNNQSNSRRNSDLALANHSAKAYIYKKVAAKEIHTDPDAIEVLESQGHYSSSLDFSQKRWDKRQKKFANKKSCTDAKMITKVQLDTLKIHLPYRLVDSAQTSIGSHDYLNRPEMILARTLRGSLLYLF